MPRNATLVIGLIGVLTIACNRGADQQTPSRAVRIVHVVTSDLFQGEAPRDDLPGPQALKAVLQWVASGEDVEADALVLSGDLGLTTTPSPPSTNAAPAPPSNASPASPTNASPASPTAKPPAPSNTTAPGPDADARAKVIASILETAPRSMPVYVVPGGRALAPPARPSQALAEVQKAIELVRGKLPAGSVSLVDLSRCYVAATPNVSQCEVRLPGRQVRLVAYPAFALSGTPSAEAIADQQKWTTTFKSAMEAQESGWQTVVIAPLVSPVTEHWPADSRATWNQAAAGAVTRIGVSPPSHTPRATYEQNQGWAEQGLEGGWIPTPRLVTTTTGTRRPAQGASVVSVTPDASAHHQVFWYAPEGAAFRGQPIVSTDAKPWWFTRGYWYLWSLGNLSPLARTSLFAVAFLAAFLTIVAVWQIPATSSSFTATAPAATNAAAAAGAAAAGAAPAGGAAPQAPTAAGIQGLTSTTFLSGNFAKTVVSGLSGLAVAMLILDALWTASKADAQGYYVVWFILFFIGLLVTSSLFRGTVEGIRAITVTARPTRELGSTRWWLRRPGQIRWFFLVLGDVMFNVIQGRNEVKSAVLGETIRDLQLAALLAVDRVCESLGTSIAEFVEDKLKTNVTAGDIRVSVTVLADDGKRTYYVSAPPQSMASEFGEKSVAWVVVVAGEARWFVQDDPKYATIQLFDNSAKDDKVFPGHPDAMMLADYRMKRKDDYQAFIVIPIPVRRRGVTQGQRQAGLHISFRNAAHMSAIWGAFVAAPYTDAVKILDDAPPELRAVLKQGVDVIEAAVRHFNEVLFTNDLRLRRRS